MATVRCGNCGALVELPTTSEVTIGRTISKESKGDYVLDMQTTTVKSNIKEDNNMENFDLNKLAMMVAEQIKADAKNVTTEKATEVRTVVDGNGIAETSKYYGKEMCGYIWSPYLDRRHLPKKFLYMMKEFNLNVDNGIRYMYSYMEGIEYCIKECKTLASMEKHDPIAFDERKEFWTVRDMKYIFFDYLDKCSEYIRRQLEYCNGKYVKIGGRGKLDVKSTERIVNHRIVVDNSLVDNRVYGEIQNAKDDVNKAYSYRMLYKAMDRFKKIKLPSRYLKKNEWDYSRHEWSTYRTTNWMGYKPCRIFIDNFKKAGAYYTVKNLLIHEDENRYGFTFENYEGKAGIDYLRSLINEPGFIIYAKLKDAIRNCSINLGDYNF